MRALGAAACALGLAVDEATGLRMRMRMLRPDDVALPEGFQWVTALPDGTLSPLSEAPRAVQLSSSNDVENLDDLTRRARKVREENDKEAARELSASWTAELIRSVMAREDDAVVVEHEDCCSASQPQLDAASTPKLE